jgi:hypothetical protein
MDNNKLMCLTYVIILLVIAVALVPIATAQPIPPSKYIVSYEEVIDSNAYAGLYISTYAKIDEIKRGTNLNKYTLALMPPSGVEDKTETRNVFVIVDNPRVGEIRIHDQKRFTIDKKIGIPLTEGDNIVVVGKAGKFKGMRRDIHTGSKGTIILLLTKGEYEDRKDMINTKAREIAPGVAALGSVDLSLLDNNVQLLNGLVSAPTHTGTIIVSSSPSGASIYVNDVYAGTTPLTLYDTPEGSYTIELTKSGYEDISRDVRVRTHKTSSVSCDLNRIHLFAPDIVSWGVISGIIALILLLSVFIFYRKKKVKRRKE